MLDKIGKILKERFPEHLGGYLNGWLDVGSYETKDKRKITTVSSSGQELFTMVEFELDRRYITQLFSKGQIMKTIIV